MASINIPKMLNFSIFLLILPSFSSSFWLKEGFDAIQWSNGGRQMRGYIAGETPILPGSLGRRNDQQQDMMGGGGLGQLGRSKDGYEDEDSDAEDHIGESPNSVEAGAKAAEAEQKRRQQKIGGQNVAFGRVRRAHDRRRADEFLEEIFE